MENIKNTDFKPFIRSNSIRSAVALRNGLSTVPGFSRHEFNLAIRDVCRERGIRNTEYQYARDKCFTRGHDWGIANGFQSLYDNGVDVPSQCRRCGEIEM